MSSDISPNRRDFLVSAAVGTAGGIVSLAPDSAAARVPLPEAIALTEPQLNEFLDLSRALTGEDNLPRDLGRQYRERFRETHGADLLDRLLQEHKKILSEGGTTEDKRKKIKERIMSAEYLGYAAEQLIYLWYLSAFFMPNPLDPERREDEETPVPVVSVSSKIEAAIPAKIEAVRTADSDDEPKRGYWRYGTLEQFERALVWTTISAHAPMTSGGEIGHWAEKPKPRRA